jgi:hypothetical protein
MPSDRVYQKQGKTVPSVSEILGLFGQNPDGLLHWAARLTKDGKEWKDERTKAANIGTFCHEYYEDCVDAMMRGEEIPSPESVKIPIQLEDSKDQIRNACGSFFMWSKVRKVEPLHNELKLVSEKHGFGGTSDCVGYIDGEGPYLLDWKTSGSFNKKMILQTAAYAALANEHLGLQINKSYIVRFDKDCPGLYAEHLTENLYPAWQIFKKLLEINQLQKGYLNI